MIFSRIIRITGTNIYMSKELMLQVRAEKILPKGTKKDLKPLSEA